MWKRKLERINIGEIRVGDRVLLEDLQGLRCAGEHGTIVALVDGRERDEVYVWFDKFDPISDHPKYTLARYLKRR